MSLIAVTSGDFCVQTFNLLKRIYENEACLEKPNIMLLDDLNNPPAKPDIDILVLGAAFKQFNDCSAFLKEEGFLLINSDEKPMKSKIKLQNATPVSYGFNHKSSVTASGVSHGEYKTIQLCIQRPIPTVLGGTMIEQEFSVSIGDCDADDHCILAAVTAALVNGLPPKSFSNIVYQL